ncbi:cyclic pyranopterin monophosphate synthase MoaC [Anaeromyxobacter oryzae]|uniref:cyclic pyranopterin monophosphate synthase n=1 Tax=Anaeromyxobacter oryzae TaxID=2918170 RepID=A0ABN6MXG2_9BACT|nr:cyclic pyranopterin monophosphate synthase MoaC [Anaeromyxobacter oryzae]BDG05556.1 cyclic pyranopterin monophosphate synthase accessory protein [Anaeromyxobacter oryzae]
MRDGPSRERFHMIDVGEKPATRRRAVARGRIEMSRAAFDALRGGANPKGDVLAQAEVAGILAAKRTSELLPLCHPLALDRVRVGFELVAGTCSVIASCEAAATARTGVEMEALQGVTGALLAIYDLSKAVDPVLTISDVHLDVKEGGKSGRWVHPRAVARAAGGADEEGATT